MKISKQKNKKFQSLFCMAIFVLGFFFYILNVSADSLDYTAGVDDFSGQTLSAVLSVAVVPLGAPDAGKTYVVNGDNKLYRYDTSGSGIAIDPTFTPVLLNTTVSNLSPDWPGDNEIATPAGGLAVDVNGYIYIGMKALVSGKGDAWNDGFGNYDDFSYSAINVYSSTGILIKIIDPVQFTNGTINKEIRGLAVTASDVNNIKLYAVDYLNNYVFLYNTTAGVNNFLAPVGIISTPAIIQSSGIALDSATDLSANVYVTDLGDNSVKKFTFGLWNAPSLTLTSDGTTTINFPYGVAIDAIGNIFVSDSLRSRILQFNSAGVFKAKSSVSSFMPFSIAIGNLGTNLGKIFVFDVSNNLVKRFTLTIPNVVPTAPVGPIIAEQENSLAIINFTTPVSNGGSAIIDYTATSSPGGFTGTCASASACIIAVNGLTNGTPYTFTVVARNSVGQSPASIASNSITPSSLHASTYTSTPQALDGSNGFGNITFSAVIGANNGMTVKVRSCDDAACSSAGTINETIAKNWSIKCRAFTATNGANSNAANDGGCMSIGDKYVQYQIKMSTTDLTVPGFSNVQIANVTGYSKKWQTLISSPFDTGNYYTVFKDLTWIGGANTNAKFQIRTAPDLGGAPDWGSGSGWCGPGDARNCSQFLGDGGLGGNFTAGSNPFGVAVDTVNGFVWVANVSSGNVSKLDATTGAKIGDYATGASPIGVAVDTVNGFVWVANYSTNKVSKLDAATGAKIGDYAVGTGPYDVEIDTVNGFVWVANDTSGNVSKLDATTGVKIADYAVGGNSSDIALDMVSGSVWVNTSSSGTNNITKLDATTGAKIGDYAVAVNTKRLTVDTVNGFVWVVNFATSNNVHKLNANNPDQSYYQNSVGNSINSIQRDNIGNRWVQYAAFMSSSDGTSTPTALSSLTASFNFNSTPTFSNVSAVQLAPGIDTGKIRATFRIKDDDVGSTDPTINNRAYQGFFYQPSGVRLTNQLATTTSIQYNYINSAVQTYTPPADIKYAKIDAIGAAGRNGIYLGGGGGKSSGLLAVLNQPYYILVGGFDGWGGGGKIAGNSGGGMTWFSTVNTFTQADVIMVAGGGGGGSYNGYGGPGGGASGVMGGWLSPNIADGLGGTQSAGGAAGIGDYAGNAGGAGFGGDCNVAAGSNIGCGGGGYWGGGAGAAENPSGIYHGGGGGSGYVKNTLLNASTTAGAGAGAAIHGSLTITPYPTLTIDRIPSIAPIPTSGFILVDDELMQYMEITDNGNNTTSLVISKRAACFDDPATAYCTVQTAHSQNAAVYFKATQVVYGSANPLTLTSTVSSDKTMTWDSKNEPNMTASLDGSVWNGWNFKVAASDGGYGSNTGSAMVTTNIDFKAPVISNILPNDGSFIKDVSNKFGFTSDEALNSAPIAINYSSGTADSNHTCNLTAGVLGSGTNILLNLTNTYCGTSQTLVNGTTYALAMNATDLFGNSAPTSAAKFFTYDTTPPTLLSIDGVNSSQSYGIGDSIPIKLTFSEPIWSSGSINITLKTGPLGVNSRTCTIAPIAVNNPTATPTCNYVIVSGDDTQKLYASALSDLASAGVSDRAGNIFQAGSNWIAGDFSNAAKNLSQSGLIIDTVNQTRIRGNIMLRGNVIYK